MSDNRTAEPTTTEHLRALLDERGVEWKSGRVYNNNTSWNVSDSRIIAKELTDGTLLIQQYSRKHFTPEQAIAATLGSERDEIYSAGFDSGVKSCLQILDGYLDYPHSALENISKWVDEQWKERES